MAGIAVAPGAKLVILFASTRAESAAHVSLTDSEDVVVRAPVGAAAFTSNDDRLVIENAGSSATFEIEIHEQRPTSRFASPAEPRSRKTARISWPTVWRSAATAT